MVAASRKTHPKSTASSAPVPSDADSAADAARPAPPREPRPAAGRPAAAAAPPPCPENLRALYDHLAPHLERWRAEIFDGRLVVSPIGSPEHQWSGSLLLEAFLPVARERGWRAWPGVDVCVPGSRHPYQPDFAMAPKDAPRWGGREIFTDGLIMVGEVVSPGSADLDRDHKPGIYAGGGVPIMLLVDPLRDPPAVTVFSAPKEGRYTRTASVEMGEKLHIPDPVDFVFDTSALLED